MTHVWVITGEAEFSDGGTVQTFDEYRHGVYSTPDLAWAAMHRGYGTTPKDHERYEYAEGDVGCRRCVGSIVKVEMDAVP